MSRLSVIRQDDFTGGLNLRADQFQLGQNESPRMLNVEIDPRGGVFSRGGMRRINTSPVTGTWNPEILFPFYGSTNFLMCSTGYKLVGLTPTNGDIHWSDGGTFTSLAIPVSNEHGASFAPWGKTLYMATGTTTVPYKWNGTTKTACTPSGPTWQNSYTSPTVGTPYMPKAAHTITHAGKVFVANTVEDSIAYPNRIRWSHPNNPENWAALDFIDINDGGTGITALAVVSGQLVVFKNKSVFAVFGYDSDTFQVVEISRSIGSPTPHCVATTENGVFFFTYPDGLMFYDGKTVSDLFTAIRPAIQNGDVNPAAVDEIYVNYVNRRIWVSMPYSETSTYDYPTTSFVFDTTVSKNGAWLQFATADSCGATGGCDFIKNDGSTLHVIAHPLQPYVLNVDVYSSSSDNITGTEYQFTSRYRTRWIDAGSYSQLKMFRRPDVVVKQSNSDTSILVTAYANYEEAENTHIRQYPLNIPASGSGMIWGYGRWGAGTWGAPNVGSQVVTGRGIGLVRSVQLEFTGPVSRTWGINSYSLKYNPRKVKA